MESALTELFLKGDKLVQEKKYQEALALYTNEIEVTPKNEALYLKRLKIYKAMDDSEKVLEEAKKCIEINSAMFEAYGEMGIAYANMDQHLLAVEAFENASKINPESRLYLPNLVFSQLSHEFTFEKKVLLDIKERLTCEVDKKPLSEYFKESDTYKSQLILSLKAYGENVMEEIQDLKIWIGILILGLPLPNDYICRQLEDNDEFHDLVKSKPHYMKNVLEMAEHIIVAFGRYSLEHLTQHVYLIKSGKFSLGVRHILRVFQFPPSVVDAISFATPVTCNNSKAEEKKDAANKLYKEKAFAKALEMYAQSLQLNCYEINILTNMAAAYIEMNDYQSCLAICNFALLIKEEFDADYEKVAKIYLRMATCYRRMESYDKSIEMYEKSLLENRTRNTLLAISEVKLLKEKKDREALIDPSISEEHRLKGNDHFKKGNFPEAKQEYDEAIKRNPENAIVYSNRAAALTKLLEYPSALKDCEKALELDPTFLKAWSRKGTIHCLMKEYTKSLEAYDKGLAIDSTSQECINGRQRTMECIHRANSSTDIDQEQLSKGMEDPEIRQIISDPQIQMALREAQQNPAAAQTYLKDPKFVNALQKLVASGMIKIQ